MNTDDLDWNDLRALIAAAEAGSLSGAAARLGASQPTVGRRIDALEAALGARLFDRGPRGLALTASGADFLGHAKEMEAAAARLSLAAAGRGETLEGTVRITAPETVSHFHLPSILSALIEAEPGIEVELVASNAVDNLLLREADIAVRMFRPTQSDLIARKVGDWPLALYASLDYLDRHGEPTMGDFASHRMVGYDRDPLIADTMAALGLEAPRAFFRLRTDDQVANWRMVVAGGGIGGAQTMIGDAEPAVRRVLPEIDMPVLEVWLTTHAELRTSALIRRVYDHLAASLAAIR